VSAPSPVLEVRHLTREVCTDTGRLKIVDDFSYSFAPAKIYTVLGPSGAGKSSLLRLMNRLDEPSSGEIIFDSHDYRTLTPCLLRCKVGYLFQTPHLFAGSVADNVRFARPELTDGRVGELLTLTSFKSERKDEPTDNLSVGEQQRVALARLLATEPTVMLLDEPTAALDPTYTGMIESAIKRIVAEKGVTAIMVSHNPEQALRMNGEGLLLVGGRLVESGPIADLLGNPRTEEARRYRDKELT